MRWTAYAFRRLRMDESGISILELLVAASISMVVLGAVLTAFEAFGRTVPKDRERAHAIHEAQVGLDRMVRELRQAYEVVDQTPDSMHVKVQVGTEDREVFYSCAEPHPTLSGIHRCVRWQVTGGLAGAKAVVVDRTLNGPDASPGDRTFRQSDPGSPSWITVKVQVPAAGEGPSGYSHKVTLDDGFQMRNCDVGC